MPDQSSTPFDQGLYLVHLNRGKEFFELRSYAEAEEELEQARRMRPTDEVALNLLGLSYFKQEKYREADKVYSSLIELNPESEVLHFNQGLICFKLGSLDRAEAAFLQTLELAPDNQKASFYLGNIYEKKAQFYNAIFQYRKAGASIMVKRVQSKIEEERETKTGAPKEVAEVETEKTQPPPSSAPAQPESVAEPSPHHHPQLTVDHIDRRRFLNALQENPVFRSGEPQSQSIDTHEKDRVLAAVGEHLEQKAAEPAPPVGVESPEQIDTPPPVQTTVVDMAEPVIQDQSLTELTASKTLSTATQSLFAAEPEDDSPATMPPAADEDTVKIKRPSKDQSFGSQTTPLRRHIRLEDEEKESAPLYSQLRRKDDIFRYLEDNLMEINFSGKVFIKQGSIYSYSGNLTFWVKPQKGENVSPLVIVSGNGKLLLSDRQREISVIQLKEERIFVEPSHLLACQETLSPRYAVIHKEEGSGPELRVLVIEGTGMIALSVVSSPLLLTVTEDLPVNISSANIISWSGRLNPSIVEDSALDDLMFPHNPQAVNLRLEGSGKVMMEKLTF
jgi:uncharacterized protein (AIM24 family)